MLHGTCRRAWPRPLTSPPFETSVSQCQWTVRITGRAVLAITSAVLAAAVAGTKALSLCQRQSAS